MARPATSIDNSDLQNLFSNFDEFHELSGWIQDVLYGAANSGHSRPSSPYALFQALRALQTIDLESVTQFVNIKSETIDGRTFSRSHNYSFMNRLMYARKAIEFHYEKKTGGKLRDLHHRKSTIAGDFCYFDGVSRSELFSDNV